MRIDELHVLDKLNKSFKQKQELLRLSDKTKQLYIKILKEYVRIEQVNQAVFDARPSEAFALWFKGMFKIEPQKLINSQKLTITLDDKNLKEFGKMLIAFACMRHLSNKRATAYTLANNFMEIVKNLDSSGTEIVNQATQTFGEYLKSGDPDQFSDIEKDAQSRHI